MRWTVVAQHVCDSGIETWDVAGFDQRPDAVDYARKRNDHASISANEDVHIYYVRDDRSKG